MVQGPLDMEKAKVLQSTFLFFIYFFPLGETCLQESQTRDKTQSKQELILMVKG